MDKLKVLLVFPMADKQTGLFLKHGFEDLACEVIDLDAKKNPNDTLKYIRTHNPDLLFCSRTHALAPIMREVKKEFPELPLFCFNNDPNWSAKGFGPELLDLFNTVDILYFKPQGLEESYRKECPNTIVKWMPEAIDPSLCKRENLSAADHKKYDCDVAFIGTRVNHYKTPEPFGRAGTIDYVIDKCKSNGIKMKTWGYNPPGANRVYNSEHNKACQCAKIVIGHCGWATVAHSNSYRDWVVMGAGGFLLTEYTEKFEELVKIGEECEVYKTPQECFEKIQYFLKHEEERKRIADRGYEAARQRHTYKERLKAVLSDYYDLKAKRKEHVHHMIQGHSDASVWGLYNRAIQNATDSDVFVEIGCWKGKSASYLAVEAIRSEKDIQIFCVDTWKGNPSDKPDSEVNVDNVKSVYGGDILPIFKENIRKFGLDAVVTPIQKPSNKAYSDFEDGSLGFVFIDADHAYSSVIEDMELWYPKVRSGGIFSGHDYVQKEGHPVKRAVDEFAQKHGLKIEFISTCWYCYK